jgi:hypothetical protein
MGSALASPPVTSELEAKVVVVPVSVGGVALVMLIVVQPEPFQRPGTILDSTPCTSPVTYVNELLQEKFEMPVGVILQNRSI